MVCLGISCFLLAFNRLPRRSPYTANQTDKRPGGSPSQRTVIEIQFGTYAKLTPQESATRFRPLKLPHENLDHSLEPAGRSRRVVCRKTPQRRFRLAPACQASSSKPCGGRRRLFLSDVDRSGVSDADDRVTPPPLARAAKMKCNSLYNICISSMSCNKFASFLHNCPVARF